MLCSYEGETREGFRYSILKTDKSKVISQFLKSYKTTLLVQDLGAVTYVYISPFITKLTALQSCSTSFIT